MASLFFASLLTWLRLGPDKHAKKELGQYPAILTSHLVNNPYMYNANKSLTYHFALNIVVIDQIGMEDGSQVTPSCLSSTAKLFSYFSPPTPWFGVTQAFNLILIVNLAATIPFAIDLIS